MGVEIYYFLPNFGDFMTTPANMSVALNHWPPGYLLLDSTSLDRPPMFKAQFIKNIIYMIDNVVHGILFGPPKLDLGLQNCLDGPPT